MIEKILAIIYLGIIAILVIFYLAYVIDDWITRFVHKKALKRIREEMDKKSDPTFDVVGKTTTKFLAPLTFEADEPFMSEELEPETELVDAEPEISPEDVEVNPKQTVMIDDDELEDYSADNSEPDGLSKGLTFEQISHAVEVVEGRKSNESDEYRAGETFMVMPTDFVDAICKQTEYETSVKRLISCYVDMAGKVKPVPANGCEFWYQ